MERMTNKYNGENILLCGYCDGDQCNKEDCAAECPCKCEQDAIDRLAAYEDAEEQGLLVRLNESERKEFDEWRKKCAEH